MSWVRVSINNKKIEPNSNLGGAIAYLLKHEVGLRKFLEVPGVKLDNNYMERTLRLVVLGRKNSHFFKTQAGVAISDVIMVLAATAHKAQINVFNYFTDLQRDCKLAKADPMAWVPWRNSETLKSLNPSKAAI